MFRFLQNESLIVEERNKAVILYANKFRTGCYDNLFRVTYFILYLEYLNINVNSDLSGLPTILDISNIISNIDWDSLAYEFHDPKITNDYRNITLNILETSSSFYIYEKYPIFVPIIERLRDELSEVNLIV